MGNINAKQASSVHGPACPSDLEMELVFYSFSTVMWM